MKTTPRRIAVEIEQLEREILALVNRRAALLLEGGSDDSTLRSTGASPAGKISESSRTWFSRLTELVRANGGPLSDTEARAVLGEVARATASCLDRTAQRAGDAVTGRPGRTPGFEVGGVKIGPGAPCLIAGPCAVESEEQIETIARALSARGVRLLRAGLFKPRSSPRAFQGLGADGLAMVSEIAKRYGLLTVTEVTSPETVELVAGYADMLQVGTRNMFNYALLEAVGSFGKPVLLKRGFMATMEETLFACEYILRRGNQRVVLCERGIRTFEPWTRNTLDVAAIPILKAESGLPVIADVSHAGGRQELVAPLARAAMAAGADGLMVEVHPNPPDARSDLMQQLDLERFGELLDSLDWPTARAEEPASDDPAVSAGGPVAD